MISLGILSLSSASLVQLLLNENFFPSEIWNVFGLPKLELNSSVLVFHWHEIKEKNLRPL